MNIAAPPRSMCPTAQMLQVLQKQLLLFLEALWTTRFNSVYRLNSSEEATSTYQRYIDQRVLLELMGRHLVCNSSKPLSLTLCAL